MLYKTILDQGSQWRRSTQEQGTRAPARWDKEPHCHSGEAAFGAQNPSETAPKDRQSPLQSPENWAGGRRVRTCLPSSSVTGNKDNIS